MLFRSSLFTDSRCYKSYSIKLKLNRINLLTHEFEASELDEKTSQVRLCLMETYMSDISDFLAISDFAIQIHHN